MENITADFIIEKLNKLDDTEDRFILRSWTLEERK